MLTLTGSGKQLRVWYSFPGSIEYDHIDSCGVGLLFGIYGHPEIIKRYLASFLGVTHLSSATGKAGAKDLRRFLTPHQINATHVAHNARRLSGGHFLFHIYIRMFDFGEISKMPEYRNSCSKSLQFMARKASNGSVVTCPSCGAV